MNILDAVLIGAVFVGFMIGYRKGFIKEALGIGSVIIGALATFIYFKNGGSPIFLFLVFILTSIIVSVIFRILRRLSQPAQARLSFSQRLGGGAIGIIKGLVFAAIALIALDLLAGVIKITMPDIDKYTGSSALYNVYKGINLPFNKAAVQSKSQSFKGGFDKAGPPEEAVNKLTKNASVKAILEDQQLMEIVNQKDFLKIISNPKFINLLNDKDFLKQVIDLGLRRGGQPVQKER